MIFVKMNKLNVEKVGTYFFPGHPRGPSEKGWLAWSCEMASLFSPSHLSGIKLLGSGKLFGSWVTLQNWTEIVT